LYAPTHFDLDDQRHRAELLQFLRVFREIVVIRKKRVEIDFSRTEKMVSSGTLLFLAEAKRVMVLTKGLRKVTYRHVFDAKVNEVLHQIGFYQAIHRPRKVVPAAEDVVHWRAVTGTGAEGEKAGEFVETVGGKLPEALNSPMYVGLVEAMTNCAQHAYLQPRPDGLRHKGTGEWWMFAQERVGNLSVAFCDLGIGIPNSLPLTQGSGVMRQLAAQAGRATGMVLTDADLVRAAFEVGKSRSGERHRGKGLQDVVDVIDAAGSGVLQIYSNKGCYTYQVKDGVPAHNYRNYKTSIMGTLIQWIVPLYKGEAPP
jgi:hypothetical protein